MNPTIKDLKIAVDKELASENKPSMEELEYKNHHGLALNLANYRDVLFSSVIALYVLADVLQVHGLKDQVVTALVHVYGYTDLDNRTGRTMLFWDTNDSAILHKPSWLVGPSKGINIAWELLPKGCHLRRLLLVLFCDNATVLDVKAGEASFNPEFQEEAYTVMAGRWYEERSTTRWSNGKICKFHDHDIKCLLPPDDDPKDTDFPDHAFFY